MLVRRLCGKILPPDPHTFPCNTLHSHSSPAPQRETLCVYISLQGLSAVFSITSCRTAPITPCRRAAKARTADRKTKVSKDNNFPQAMGVAFVNWHDASLHDKRLTRRGVLHSDR